MPVVVCQFNVCCPDVIVILIIIALTIIIKADGTHLLPGNLQLHYVSYTSVSLSFLLALAFSPGDLRRFQAWRQIVYSRGCSAVSSKIT